MLRLLAWASTNRALIVAILLVVLCWWLLRPKPLTAPAEQATGAPSGRASTHPATFVPKKRAVSVSTPGVLLHFRAGVPEVDDSALTALLSLCAVTDIYLVTQLETDSDVQEEAVMAALEAAGVFGEGACDRRKVICCATEDGRAAIIRQLSPRAHIETSHKVAQYLAPHIPSVVLIGEPLPDGSSTGSIGSCSSLADYAYAELGRQ